MPKRSPEPRHPMGCPVCKLRMELMHRQGDHVTAGCQYCQISITMPAFIWDAAKIERDAEHRNKPDVSSLPS